MKVIDIVVRRLVFLRWLRDQGEYYIVLPQQAEELHGVINATNFLKILAKNGLLERPLPIDVSHYQRRESSTQYPDSWLYEHGWKISKKGLRAANSDDDPKLLYPMLGTNHSQFVVDKASKEARNRLAKGLLRVMKIEGNFNFLDVQTLTQWGDRKTKAMLRLCCRLGWVVKLDFNPAKFLITEYGAQRTEEEIRDALPSKLSQCVYSNMKECTNAEA